MDQIKNAINSASHSGSSTGAQANPQQAGGAQQEDYLDKAFDMGVKKSGHNIDRNTSEKITDGAREMFEKATGKQVNPKISN